MAITGAPSSVQGVFALDILTAGLAFILCITATILASRKQTYRSLNKPSSSKSGRGTSPTGTYVFLVPGALLLAVAYSVASANVALSYNNHELAPITEAYSLEYRVRDTLITRSTGTEAGLSFAKGFTNMFATIMLNGAVWLHSSHVTSNGTGIGEPSFLSIIWNTVILLTMTGTGLASWGEALAVRSSSEEYSTVLDHNTVSRALYITFRCCVIVASVSVSVEAIKRYRQVNANGLPGNSERPILARLAFLAVPVFLLRDMFIIVDIVLFYVGTSTWSYTSQQAMAFLLIIFNQLANLAIFTIVAWGAYSMGRIDR